MSRGRRRSSIVTVLIMVEDMMNRVRMRLMRHCFLLSIGNKIFLKWEDDRGCESLGSVERKWRKKRVGKVAEGFLLHVELLIALPSRRVSLERSIPGAAVLYRIAIVERDYKFCGICIIFVWYDYLTTITV